MLTCDRRRDQQQNRASHHPDLPHSEKLDDVVERYGKIQSGVGPDSDLRSIHHEEHVSVQGLRAPTVSQPCHAFAEPGGYRRTREDARAGEIEYRRTLEEPTGHGRTRHDAGSGP